MEHQGHSHENGVDYHADPATGDQAPQLDQEEIKHFRDVLRAFRYYEEHSRVWMKRMQMSYDRLPDRQKELLPGYEDKMQSIWRATMANVAFLETVTRSEELFANQDMAPLFVPQVTEGHVAPSEQDMEKVRSTIRQCMRDWSEEGAMERDMCYTPFLETLNKRYAAENRSKTRVLCPGSGLGRLPFEIARLGFECQGNEFSYFMLIVSNFLLNRTQTTEQFEIYPFVHQVSNVLSDVDQVRPARLPDVVPGEWLNGQAEFSMCAGDFLESYGNQREEWDCVAACFFMDTAHNVIDYVEVVNKILKPGGLLIHLGPLLFHYADTPDQYSIELSYDQFRHVVCSLGFRIEHEEMRESTYCNNKLGMMKVVYDCAFMIAVKERSLPDFPPPSGRGPGVSSAVAAAATDAPAAGQ